MGVDLVEPVADGASGAGDFIDAFLGEDLGGFWVFKGEGCQGTESLGDRAGGVFTQDGSPFECGGLGDGVDGIEDGVDFECEGILFFVGVACFVGCADDKFVEFDDFFVDDRESAFFGAQVGLGLIEGFELGFDGVNAHFVLFGSDHA